MHTIKIFPSAQIENRDPAFGKRPTLSFAQNQTIFPSPPFTAYRRQSEKLFSGKKRRQDTKEIFG